MTGRNDSAFVNRIQKAINRAIKEWARILPWPTLETVDTITHTGGRYLYLPGNISKLIWLVDKTNKLDIPASSRVWDRDYTSSYANDTTGRAVEHEDAGISCVTTDVSGPIAMYSTDESDVTGYYIVGKTEYTPGEGVTLPDAYKEYSITEELSSNGMTPVTSTANFVSVESISKTADTSGAIIIECGDCIVGMVGPLESQSAYRKIALMQIPSAGTQFLYKGYLEPADLTETNQSPPPTIDPDFLIWRATADVYWQL
ncbi:MAG: hypothetical protein DRJ03_18510, partial [Chloroflexi bacterium]